MKTSVLNHNTFKNNTTLERIIIMEKYLKNLKTKVIGTIAWAIICCIAHFCFNQDGLLLFFAITLGVTGITLPILIISLIYYNKKSEKIEAKKIKLTIAYTLCFLGILLGFSWLIATLFSVKFTLCYAVLYGLSIFLPDFNPEKDYVL